MAIFDNMLDKFGLRDPDEYEDEPEEGVEEQDDYDDYEEEVKPVKKPIFVSRTKQEKTEVSAVNDPNSQLEVVLVKPERFEEATSIAVHLNEKRSVVLNLESTKKDISRRIVDFLSGVAFAHNGTIKRVANSTFIITPQNVDVQGDTLSDDVEVETTDVYF